MKRVLALVLSIMLAFSTIGGTVQPAYAADIDAPLGVSVKANKSGNPVITWKEVDGAKQYRVFRKTASDSEWVKVTTTSKLKATDTKWSADAGTTIQYVVKVSTKNGKKTVWSNNSKTVKWTVPSKEVKKSDTGKTEKKDDTTKTDTEMVWIPATGSKYHRTSTCSNMKNPSYVSKSYAISKGYTPCKKCY